KRVSQYAIRPAIAVTTATATAQPLKWLRGKSLDQTSISRRNPTPTAGTIATARAAARPPGIHHPPRNRPCEAAVYTSRSATAARKIQTLECESGSAASKAYDAKAIAYVPTNQRTFGGSIRGQSPARSSTRRP